MQSEGLVVMRLIFWQSMTHPYDQQDVMVSHLLRARLWLGCGMRF